MNDEIIQKLQELFHRKMEEVYKENARVDPFSDAQIFEFNAWQDFLRNSLSLEVDDIEDGDTPGIVMLGGREVAVRILNPSNATKYSHEFIIVPLDLAERCLMLQWIPKKRPPSEE